MDMLSSTYRRPCGRRLELTPPWRAIFDHSSQSSKIWYSSSLRVTAHLVVLLTLLILSSWNLSMRYF